VVDQEAADGSEPARYGISVVRRVDRVLTQAAIVKTVLHLIESSEPGGSETIVASLVQNQDAKQFRPVVGLLEDGWLCEKLVKGGVTTHVIPQKRGLDARWIGECIRLIRQYDVRLVHTHEFTMNVYGVLAARLVDLPTIATVHSRLYAGDKWHRRFAYRLVGRYTADRMVAVSEDLKRFLVEHIGVGSANLCRIYNGIDTAAFAPRGQQAQIRRELGIAENSVVIGTTGALRPIKGHTIC
jgi:glycosyltransferase involved in cell wall biosynthesis